MGTEPQFPTPVDFTKVCGQQRFNDDFTDTVICGRDRPCPEHDAIVHLIACDPNA